MLAVAGTNMTGAVRSDLIVPSLLEAFHVSLSLTEEHNIVVPRHLSGDWLRFALTRPSSVLRNPGILIRQAPNILLDQCRVTRKQTYEECSTGKVP